MEHNTLDISWETILKICVAGLILYMLFLIRSVVIWLFFALIISILLDPAVRFLQKLRLPKVLAVIIIYGGIFGGLGLMIFLIAPLFATEISQFVQNIPEYFEKINPLLKNFGISLAEDFESIIAAVLSNLEESSKSIVKAVSIFFGGVSSAILIFIFAFYISLGERSIAKGLAIFLPARYEGHVEAVFEQAQTKVAGWFGARLLSCVFVGLASFVVFLLFGVKYAIVLSLIAGTLNFVPFIGPVITALAVLIFVGISDSWATAIYIFVALTLIQEVDNKVVTPLLMKKFLDIPPLLVLISIIVGGIMFGFLGIVFMVPVAGIIYEFLMEFLEKRKIQAA